MKKILSAFAVLLTLTFGRACSRSAKLKHVWLCSCLLAALTACNSNEPKAESAATTDGMAIVVCGDMQKALEETITYL